MAIKVILVVAAVLLVGFLAIQFVPVQRTNPPVVTHLDWDSAQTQALAQRACMDCHSNHFGIHRFDRNYPANGNFSCSRIRPRYGRTARL